jgi:phosphonoacetaldehyde hydrolase
LSNHPREIRLVIFDWAGTTIDFGCFAPLTPFIGAFANEGVSLTADEARAPMGLAKIDHLRALLQVPASAARWQQVHGQPWSESDVDRLFHEHFVPLQMQAVHDHAELIPGLLPCVEYLRGRTIRIATTTGYFGDAAQQVYQTAAAHGYRPDANLCAEDVPQGRPAPWMIFRHMETLNIFPPAAVLKIGDTVPDILEGRNAGAWSVGVTHSSSGVGLTEAELAALPEDERRKRIEAVRELLLNAGAHDVIDTIADVPALLDRINARLALNEKP